MLRCPAIFKSIGLLFIVLGLIFTIYGHIADQRCCEDDGEKEEEDIEYENKDSVNTDVIKYSKNIGPIVIIVGFIFIVVSIVFERRYHENHKNNNTSDNTNNAQLGALDLLTDIEIMSRNHVARQQRIHSFSTMSVMDLSHRNSILPILPSYEESVVYLGKFKSFCN